MQLSRLRVKAIWRSIGIALGVAAAFALGHESHRLRDTPKPEDPQARLVGQMLSLIRANYVDSLNDAHLTRLALEAIVTRLHDPYSTLVDERGKLPPAATANQAATVAVRALDDSMGLVTLASIGAGSASAIRHAVGRMRQAGLRGLILDLRGNPGGLVGEAADIAELFLDRDLPIGRLQGRSEQLSQHFVAKNHQEWPDLPLVILVDNKTASAAELVAGTLQEHDRALIVGTPTFGKGLAQTPYPLGDGLVLKLTTGRWFTPRGRPLDRGAVMSNEIYLSDSGRRLAASSGVTPDAIVPDDDGDAPLATARRLLQASRTTKRLLESVPATYAQGN